MSSPAQSLRRLRAIALPLLLVAAWVVIARLRLFDPNLVPHPSAVVAAARSEALTSEFGRCVVASLQRTFTGFALAAVVGIAIGVILGVSRWAERLVAPTFHAFRQIAPFAWIPLISAWVGGGEPCKIAFIAVASVTPVIFNTFEGVRSVAAEHVELARVLEVGRARFVARIVVPSAAPQILTGLHLALIVAWLATFGSEFFLQISPGVSRILIEGRALARMDLVLVGVAVIGSIGFALNTSIALVERRVLRWRPAVDPEQA
ncbi:MAG TPA: ABC transporter permease [Anaeromyxobacteraceae bacterium]|nr:ABC transporter permease [Anaeromyxobacteraceae bacterium]